jgi:hypothetical protein
MDLLSKIRLPADAFGFLADIRVVGHEIIAVAARRLIPRIPEEAFRRGIPRGDRISHVDGHDCRGAGLEQRLVVLLLLPELADVVIDGEIADPLIADADRDVVQLDVNE